jgi:hypothetical protein
MARMASRNRAEFDAAAQITLRSFSAGAVTASIAEAPVALDAMTKAYWDAGEQTVGVATVCIDVSAIKVSVGDEAYTLTFEVDTTVGMAGSREIARVVIPATVGKPGFYELPVSYSLIEMLRSGALFARIRTTTAGTLPSITYGAYIGYIDN